MFPLITVGMTEASTTRSASRPSTRSCGSTTEPTRIRGEAGHVPLRQAVTRALERTGSTITSAGLVLAGTFGVFAVVEAGQPGGSIYRDILASLAIGILMDAFLVRTLLVPSTVALLAAGTGGHRRTASPPEPPQTRNRHRHPAASHHGQAGARPLRPAAQPTAGSER